MNVRRRARRIASMLAVLACIAGAVLLVTIRRAQLAAAPPVQVLPLAVRVATAQAKPWTEQREFLGRIEARRRSRIAARVTSTVTAVAVEEGDTVTAGQLLVTLESAEFHDRLAATGAALTAASARRDAAEATLAALRRTRAFWQREVARYATLQAEDSASQVQLETARERLNEVDGRLAAAVADSAALAAAEAEARARQDEVRTRLGYTELRAPWDGVVAERLVDPGDQAAPGRSTLVLVSTARRLVLAVPQGDAPRLRPGLALTTRAGAPLGVVTSIHPVVDEAGTIRVEADLHDDASPVPAIGATCTVALVLAQHPSATAVPRAALVPTPTGSWAVFRLDADERLQPIPVERLGSAATEVFCAGLEPGTRVCLDGYLGWSRLAAGLPVTARP